MFAKLFGKSALQHPEFQTGVYPEGRACSHRVLLAGGEVPKRERPGGHPWGWAETHSARTADRKAGSDVGDHVAPPPQPRSLEEEE